MAEEKKVHMPMGAGGLIRYGEEEDTRIKLKPKYVVALVVGVVVFELVLRVLF